jgi:hypothetical protein
MNVSTITMDPAQAQAKLEQYRALLESRVGTAEAREEYTRAADAYAQLAEGTPLLVLSEVMQRAPVDAKGRPRLAVARADRRQVRFWFGMAHTPSPTANFSTRGRFQAGRVGRELEFSIALGRGYPREAIDPAYPGYRGSLTSYALVPMVPPDVLDELRAEDRSRQLKHYVTLWEVEAWADQPITATPDIDPYLLKRVADDLFAVVGEWDLTDVERAIMRDRRDS